MSQNDYGAAMDNPAERAVPYENEPLAPAPTLTAAVLVTKDSLPFLPRTLDSLPAADFDELLLVWSSDDVGMPGIASATVPTKTIIIPFSETWDPRVAVERAVQEAKSDWILVLHAGEILAPEGHVAREASKRWMRAAEEAIPFRWVGGSLRQCIRDIGNKLAASLLQAVVWTEDAAGQLALSVTQECRLLKCGPKFPIGPPFRPGFQWGPRGFYEMNEAPSIPVGIAPVAALAHLPILKQPIPAAYYEVGDDTRALQTATKLRIDERFRLKARARMERDAAFDAFVRLFQHMSLNEELHRLDVIMQHLPFDLEEDPRMDAFRKLLDQQIGHLKKGELDWYANGSPGEVTDIGLANTIPLSAMQPRLQWIVAEARKHGFKRVLEMGSVDGFNLFQLQRVCPEVEWHGIEVSEKAVEHGHKLAAQIGVKLNLHHVEDFNAPWSTVPNFLPGWALGREHASVDISRGTFDAVMVFEVLEHNATPHGVLNAAERYIAPDGHVYITTPNGNWSAWDERTRDLRIRKDHICAYTPQRMRRMLEERAADASSWRRAYPIAEIEVSAVENPAYWEANGWVHASYKVG